jgi:tRNA1(Val) A37 N6-methylase TrmN6
MVRLAGRLNQTVEAACLSGKGSDKITPMPDRAAKDAGASPAMIGQDASARRQMHLLAVGPRELWRTIEHEHVKPMLRRLRPWRRAAFGGVEVHYRKHLDGGGSTFGQDYIPLLRAWGMPRQARAFEWCAGPGFIGFSLLGHGLCDTLCLADLNPEAVRACRRTVAHNALSARVSVYQSDNLEGIPPSEHWNLVVGNPPHFADEAPGKLRFHDAGWNIHRRFFNTVGQFLAPRGVIVLQENNRGSTVETFRAMIENAGLALVRVHGCAPERTRDSPKYYLAIMRRGEAPPDWVRCGDVNHAPMP